MSSRRTDRLRPASVASHLGVMVAVAAVLGVLVAGLAIPFAAIAGLGTRNVADSMDKIPSDLVASPLSQRTRILNKDGSTLATLYDENRVNVPLAKVSPIMRKAIIAIEDYRFYQHGALDLRGTMRAFVTNQANNGETTQGGSSITQQMVKMTLITQAESAEERAAATADTYQRKIQELRYAIAFEEKYSKDWILERYLNIAYFGDGAYGVEAAARHYFSKPAAKLDLRESALLAGLVKNPTRYDPTNYVGEATQRRNTVLGRMAQLNVISATEASDAQAARIGLKVTPANNGCVSSDAAVLLRLRDPVPPGRRQARPDRRGPPQPAVRRRADDQDHPGPALPEGGRRLRRQSRLPQGRRDRRAGDGRAGHRGGARPVAVPSDGGEEEAGRDLPQLRRAQRVRRLARVPGGLDVQGVRAVGRDPAADPAADPDRLTGPDRASRTTGSGSATATSAAPTPGTRRTPPAAARSTSTPAPRSR